MQRHRDNAHAHDPGPPSEEAVSGEATHTQRHTAAVGGPPAAARHTNGQADPEAPKSSASTTTGEAPHTAVTGRPPVAATHTTPGHVDPVGPSPSLASASAGEANWQRRVRPDVFRPFNFDDSNDPTSCFNAAFRDRTPRRRPSTVWAGYHNVLNASDEFQREAITNGIRELVKDRMLNKRVALMMLRGYGFASRPAPPPSASPDQKPSPQSSPSAADAAASEATPVVDDTGVLDSSSVPSSRITGGTRTPTASASEGSPSKAVDWQPSPRRRTWSNPEIMVQLPPTSNSSTIDKPDHDEEVEAQWPDLVLNITPRRRFLSTPEADLTREFSLVWNYGHELADDEDTSNLCRIMKTIPRRHRSKEVTKAPETLKTDRESDVSIEDILQDTVARLGNASITDRMPASPVHVDPPSPAIEAPVQPADSPVRDDSAIVVSVTKEVKVEAKEVTEDFMNDTVTSLAQISVSESRVNTAVIEDQMPARSEPHLESTQSSDETVVVKMPVVAGEHETEQVVPLSRDTSSIPPSSSATVEALSTAIQNDSQKTKGSEDTAIVSSETKVAKVDAIEVTEDTIDDTVASLAQISISEGGVNSAVIDHQSARSEAPLDWTQSSDETVDVDMPAAADESGTKNVVPSSRDTTLNPPDAPVSVEEAIPGRDEADVEMEIAEPQPVERPVSPVLEQANRVVNPLYQRQPRPLITRRQSRMTLPSQIPRFQHQRQSRSHAVRQTRKTAAESPEIVESEQKREVVAAPSASAPQLCRNERQVQSKQASSQKGQQRRSNQKDGAKARKSKSRQSRNVEARPRAPVSQPQATSNPQQLTAQATPPAVPNDSLKPIQKMDDPTKQNRQSRMFMVSRLPRFVPSRRESGDIGRLRFAFISKEQRRRKSMNTKRRTKLPNRADQQTSVQNIAPASNEVDRIDGPESSNEAAPTEEVVDHEKPETRQFEKSLENNVEAETVKPVQTPSKRPRSSKMPPTSAKEPLKRRSREKNERSNQKSPHPEAPKSKGRQSRKNAKKADKTAETSKQRPQQANPPAVADSLVDTTQPIQMSERQSRLFMVSRLPRFVPSRRQSGDTGRLRFAFISREQRRRKSMNTKRRTKSPIRAEQPTSVQNIAPAKEVDRIDGPETSDDAVPANDVVNREKPETRQNEKSPAKNVEHEELPTTSKGPRSSKTPKMSAKGPIKRRKNANKADKKAETPKQRPQRAIPPTVPASLGDTQQPLLKNERQSRMFLVSRLPRFVPSPSKNRGQGKLRFSTISKEQRSRMYMNTRRSTKSPKQPLNPALQVPVPPTNRSVPPEAQPGPSKPAKSPQPPKVSKKKASTKATPATTALLPRLRSEVWMNLLRSGALRFPVQQGSANESLPISANDLSNALRKREAEECEAKSPISESSIFNAVNPEETVNTGNKSVEPAENTPVATPEKPPTPTVRPPSGAPEDRDKAAKDMPFKTKRKRTSESDSDKGPTRRPRLDVPIPNIDDQTEKDETSNADDPKKPTESDTTSNGKTMVESPAQPTPAEVQIADGPQEANGEVNDRQSDEDPQAEPAEAMEPVDAPPPDVNMDAFFDVPPPDDLDPTIESDNAAEAEANEAESVVDLDASEAGSVNGSEVSAAQSVSEASEVGSLIASEASESGSDDSERSESPGPSTRPSRKRKAAPNPNDGPSARRRLPPTDSNSDEAPQPRSNNRRGRQPRNAPTFGHLEHIEDIEGVDLPNAPPVVVRQREVVDNIRLTADQQMEVLRGNDVTVARYESGAVVMQGRFNSGSTASQLMRDAARQPVVLLNNPEDRIVQMALGNEHLVMRSISGDVYTVGRATEGQLGVARHRFFRQSSITPESMRRIVLDDEGRDVFFTDIRAEGNVTIAITRDGTEYRCGERFGPLLAKPRGQ